MADDTETVDGLRAQLTAAQVRIKELNEEAKGHRLNANEARSDLDKARTEMERVTKDAAEKSTAAEKATKEAGDRVNVALRDAALRIASKDAGLVDMDGLKLLDTSAVTVKDDGTVSIPDKFFETAKAAKPYLFKTTGADTGNTSSTSQAPGNADPGTKAAKDMSADELTALERTLGLTPTYR